MRKQYSLVLIAVVALCFAFLSAAPSFAEGIKEKPLSERTKIHDGVEYVAGEVLVKYKGNLSKMQADQVGGKFGAVMMSSHRGGVHKLAVPAGKTEQELIDLLRADPSVEFAQLNTVCHAHMVPNDTYYDPYQWDLPRINMPTAWDISTGNNVIVGILDSGVAYENYAIPSYELDTVLSGVTQYMIAPELDGTSFTAGYDFINNDSHPNDNDAHGTHVAGTIAQVTNNGTGTAGMAFDCTIMPVKVLDYSGSGTAGSLADGLYWAADNGAQVINMSLGWTPGYDPGPTVHNAITYAYNAGVVLCASSGNAGVGTVSYPAAYDEVISVGATRYDDQRSDYSQYGTGLEVVAPGGDVGVDQNGDGYGDGILQMTMAGYNPGPPEVLADPTDFSYWFYDGTSMACPHVTALVAMMIANGQTGVENIRTILHESAVDLGSTGWDSEYGYGRIDAYAALTYGGGAPPVANFSGSPTSGLVPRTVNFTDMSTGSPDAWDWNFGDGSPHSSSQNPSHEYASEGTYTVSLSVTNAYGADSEVKTGYIQVFGGGLIQSFALSDISVGGTVSGNYTATHASDNGYEVITEVTSNDNNVRKRYSYLEHKWNFNVVAGSSVTFYVEAYRPNNAEGDNFTFQYSTDNVNFTNLVTVASATEQTYSATLPVSGTVYIRVVDTNHGRGTLDNDSVYIDYMVIESVSGPVAPIAAFSGTPTSGSAPLDVNFTDLSTGDPTSWDWDFGDGSPHSGAQNPGHTYAADGLYTVTLIATNAQGSDTEVKNNYITVSTGGACDMHVDNMAVSRTTQAVFCTGRCTVWIVDATDAPVSGALVYVTATGPTSGSYNGATGADGSVSFATSKTKSCTGEWCFEVTNVAHSTCDYDAGANNVTISCESGHVSSNGGPVASHQAGIRQGFYLAPNYPNPFSGTTSIGFNLPKAGHARLEVFNAAGRRVALLVDREMPAGFQRVTWEASGTPSGVYFCRLVYGTEEANTRMIVIQ
jgi:serine protease